MLKQAKNDKYYEFKTPEVDDCVSLVQMMKQSYSETDFLTCYSDEFNISVEDEIKWISRFDHQKSTMMIVKDGNRVIGNAAINAGGSREKLKHRCTFGISILKDYHGLGIGRLLIQEMIAFAKKAGYEQIELEVVSNNYRAIQLYMSEGFRVYGTRPRAFKLRDGRYLDEYLMVKEF